MTALPAPSPARDVLRAEDLADVAIARGAEARAAALLDARGVVLEGARGSTRGPTEEARRAHALTLPADDPVRTALAEADAACWRMVLRHDALIRRHARWLARYTPNLRADPEVLVQLVRLGWYRAALRFDPAAGHGFPTYAGPWGKVTVQGANDRHAVLVPSRRSFKEDGGWSSFLLPSLDDAIPGTEVTLGETVYAAADPHAEDDVLGGLVAARLRAALLDLSEAHRAVIVGRFYDGRSLAAIGTDLGTTKQNVSQIERRALERLRALLRAA